MKKWAVFLGLSVLFACFFCKKKEPIAPFLPEPMTCLDSLAPQPLAGWKMERIDLPIGAENVFFFNPKEGICHSAPRGVLSTVTGGLSWSELPTPPFLDDFAPFFRDDETLLAVGHAGQTGFAKELFVLEPSAQNWDERPLPAFPQSLSFLSKNVGYGVFSGIESSFQRTTDGGKTWSPEPFFEKKAVTSANFRDSIGWAHGPSFELFKTKDFGKTWEKLPAAPALEGRFDFIGEQQIFFVPHTGDRLIGSSDGGSTWALLSEKKFGSWHFFDAQHGIASFAETPTSGQFSPVDPPCVRVGETFDGGRTWAESESWNSFTHDLLAASDRFLYYLKKSRRIDPLHLSRELVVFKKE